MLQHEVEGVDTEDKETNTECVFMPRGVKSSSQPAIVIKRSQTFSPVAKNQYICRVSHITRSSLTSWAFLWLPSTDNILITVYHYKLFRHCFGVPNKELFSFSSGHQEKSGNQKKVFKSQATLKMC